MECIQRIQDNGCGSRAGQSRRDLVSDMAGFSDAENNHLVAALDGGLD